MVLSRDHQEAQGGWAQDFRGTSNYWKLTWIHQRSQHKVSNKKVHSYFNYIAEFSTFLVYNLFNFGLRLKKFESDFCIKCQIYIRKVMIVFGISSSELLSTLEASIGTSTRWPLGLEWTVDSVVASVTSSLEPAWSTWRSPWSIHPTSRIALSG